MSKCIITFTDPEDPRLSIRTNFDYNSETDDLSYNVEFGSEIDPKEDLKLVGILSQILFNALEAPTEPNKTSKPRKKKITS